MRAFSLRTLLIATAVVALCVMILGRPSLFWMRLTFSVTLATLGWWLVLAIAGGGERRRFGVAAAVVGIGYLAIALHSSDRKSDFEGEYVLGRMLITHQLLEGAARLSGPENPTLAANLSLWDSETFSNSTKVARSTAGVISGGGFGGVANFVLVPGSSPMARYQQMLISGHCLFAILFGWIAGSAAKRWLEPEADQSTAA